MSEIFTRDVTQEIGSAGDKKVTGTSVGDRRGLDVNSLNSLLGGVQFDSGTVTYPTSTQEVYSFRTGGTSGTITATVTLNYTDATKKELLDWAKS